jgi:hypothetical protein
MPNWQAPIPERLVTRNLSKIPIRLLTPNGLAFRGVAARLSLVSRQFQGVAVSDDIHMIPADPEVSSFGEKKLGKGSFAPRE